MSARMSSKDGYGSPFPSCSTAELIANRYYLVTRYHVGAHSPRCFWSLSCSEVVLLNLFMFYFLFIGQRIWILEIFMELGRKTICTELFDLQ
jgi:hypothetical protein